VSDKGPVPVSQQVGELNRQCLMCDVRARLSALVEAAEKVAPRCCICGKPACMSRMESELYMCKECYKREEKHIPDREFDSKAQALWDALNRAKGV